MKKRKLKKSVKIVLVLLLIIIILIVLILTKKKVYIPEFKNINEATSFCNVNKCKIKTTYVNDLNIDKDYIISQEPKENTKLTKNTEITLTVSKGIDYDIYANYQVNELGNVPIMMYHGIHNKTNDETEYTGGNVDKDGYQRTAEAFRKDLEFYYQEGYRMIHLNDYVDGKIDVELGKSPIILTFDDGLANNIKVTGLDESGNIIIDPNSAVGILEEFKKKYPDYHVTATFFINAGLFSQEKYNDKIIEWLLENNYDIGNHTYSHANLSNTTKEGTIKEVGSMYKILEEKTQGKYVKIVALPFGTPYVKTHANFDSIISGVYEDTTYTTKATMRVGWESEVSPFSQKFDSHFLKRIRAYDNNGLDFDIEYNFKVLKNNRYISDGNVNTIVVPKEKVENIKETNLKIISY